MLEIESISYIRVSFAGSEVLKYEAHKYYTTSLANILKVNFKFKKYGILQQQASKKVEVTIQICFFFILTRFHQQVEQR